ncbi:MAG: hypothetical protein ACFFDF_12800 [Candidatus Odinarchaeota archaeon]
MLKLKKRKFQNDRSSFAKRYQHCNRCEKELNIQNNDEIVCVLCGETFCNWCINKHQKYCYNILN